MRSTGYNRKYAISVLEQAAAGLPRRARAARQRRRTYGPDVEYAFKSLWRVSGGLCAKAQPSSCPSPIEALERFDEISLLPDVKAKLLSMGVSTAHRLSMRIKRQSEHGIGTTLPGTLLRQQIPVRTFEDWDDFEARPPGDRPGGPLRRVRPRRLPLHTNHNRHLHRWTECVAIPNRGQIAVIAASSMRKRLPFMLLGIDCDNGAEFINHMSRTSAAQQYRLHGCGPTRRTTSAT